MWGAPCGVQKALTGVGWFTNFVPRSKPARAPCPRRLQGGVGRDFPDRAREQKPLRAFDQGGPLESGGHYCVRTSGFADAPRDPQPARVLCTYGITRIPGSSKPAWAFWPHCFDRYRAVAFPTYHVKRSPYGLPESGERTVLAEPVLRWICRGLATCFQSPTRELALEGCCFRSLSSRTKFVSGLHHVGITGDNESAKHSKETQYIRCHNPEAIRPLRQC